MADVVEINDIDELEAYRLCWFSLLNETPHASFFQSLDWLQTYWNHFGIQQHLRTLVVFGGGQPIGILPLTVRQERTRAGSIAVLTYPLHDWGTFYGPISPNPAATLLAGVRHVMSTERDWDVFDPRWVNAHECDRGRTENAMLAVGARPRRQDWQTTSIIDFGNCWETHLRSRDAKFLANVRRIERHALDAGDLSFERYRPDGLVRDDADPRWDLFSQCVDLASRGWQGPSKTGTTLSDASIHAFLSDAHVAATRRGAVDVCLLRLDGQPIAYAYNYQHDGTIHGLRIGFHPSFASLDPGTLLLTHLIRDSIARGDKSLDLGVDRAEFKERWATRRVTTSRYTHYASNSPKAQLLRAKHWWNARAARPSLQQSPA